MKRTLTVVSVVLSVIAILGWYFLAPPLYFDAAGKLQVAKNNSYLVYGPRYHMHWTGVSVQSGNFRQDNQYLFCWFWSGYGISSMKIYSDTGKLLHDKAYGARKEVVNSENFKTYFDANQDWLNRDASVYLTPAQGDSFRVVLVDFLGNQFDDTIKVPAAR